MGKHKPHRGDTSRRDVLLLTCLLRTQVSPIVPYRVIAEHIVSSSLEVAQKLARKSAHHELGSTVAKDQDMLRDWLEVHLEETSKMSQDWSPTAWQVAQDCDAESVRDHLERLSFDHSKYEVRSPSRNYPASGDSKYSDACELGSHTERKHLQSPQPGGSLDMSTQSLPPLGVTNVPALLDTNMPVKQMLKSTNCSQQEPRRFCDGRTAVSTDGFSFCIASNNVPLSLEGHLPEAPHSWSGIPVYGTIPQEITTRTSLPDRGGLLHNIDTKATTDCIRPIGSPRLHDKISNIEVQNEEARRWKEHQQRVESLLQKLRIVQQKYRGFPQDAYFSLETEQETRMSLLTDVHDAQPDRLRLPRISTHFETQVEAIEILEQLHLEDRAVGCRNLSSPTFGRSKYE